MNFDPVPLVKGNPLEINDSIAISDFYSQTIAGKFQENSQKLLEAFKSQQKSFDEELQKGLAAFDQKLNNQLFRIKHYLLDGTVKVYEHNKKVAIGTGAGALAALIALVACVVFAILFPDLSLPFFIGAGVAGAALIALATPSIVYGMRAADGGAHFKSSTAWQAIENPDPVSPDQMHHDLFQSQTLQD